jgi:hypothetical protein
MKSAQGPRTGRERLNKQTQMGQANAVKLRHSLLQVSYHFASRHWPQQSTKHAATLLYLAGNSTLPFDSTNPLIYSEKANQLVRMGCRKSF